MNRGGNARAYVSLHVTTEILGAAEDVVSRNASAIAAWSVTDPENVSALRIVHDITAESYCTEEREPPRSSAAARQMGDFRTKERDNEKLGVLSHIVHRMCALIRAQQSGVPDPL
ncbi:hypothetical protein ANCDUO_27101 [Ancylostoma duodenale]|uniref:Uncharacterized protein n=1 Tax=Ancylostoma duodenale TaxID=51022 RepID=A0A0C2BGP8_9BILA|nr:hypothetical protein ANCDUO_27101 [Ancylostoma duodenale]